MKISVKHITRASVIATLYICLSLISNMLGLASGPVQLRLSEALSLLPLVFPESVAGLFIGCLISNILTGCILWDIIFGSLATLLAAYITSKCKNHIFPAATAPVLINSIVVPLVLKYAYSLGDAWWYLAVTVAIGEAIMCIGFAPILIRKIKKHIN